MQMNKDQLIARYNNKPLVKHEVRILKLLSSGLTSKEIGDKIGLNWKTVEGYISILKVKLKAKNVAHLISRGYEKGILRVSHGKKL